MRWFELEVYKLVGTKLTVPGVNGARNRRYKESTVQGIHGTYVKDIYTAIGADGADLPA